MEFWVGQTLNGLSFGALLFLLASGLSLMFGLMRIVNIAIGSYYLIGAYVALSALKFSGQLGLALLGAVAAVALIGVGMQRFLLARFHAEPQPQVLLTMGAAFMFADIALWLWGGDPQRLPTPRMVAFSVEIGPSVFPAYRLVVIAVGVLVYLFLWLIQERTRLGAIVRAAVDDQEMARGLGINVGRILTAMFAVGAGLAALAGVVGGPFLGVYPGADFEVIPLAFAVVIIGGLGSLHGALAGSLLVGLVDNFGKALFPELSYFTLFLPMALVLAIRPTGLFGKG
ncbi:MAG: branched-chain amino acid ABC transporter permease [Armatimonadota bacterium]|nr:branched-chain amino acid ABC transporter permease [Armatimonadota bacterium]MDR7426189.1 branched-chain amino acid ABC transporter permease [Armatimonadota bacterium]MDR7464046.1 branched-chain amino acid ABC transporter permease [Armatimonadota bacterium]MDR7469034.1 branched-chain amino acid ABC transporter permease [Armatimonadota bacterium]MDR7475536.1 branched-chain amino acid ABC transporter permease [Armatimonadota bacterium]